VGDPVKLALNLLVIRRKGSMDILELIKSRRSIRKFKNDRVSDEALNILLEAARWAPSWANTQCWEFIVVRDIEVKERLSRTLSSGNPAKEAIATAPITIIACAKTGIAGYYKGQPSTDKGDWYMFDVALATQNLVLAAHAIGLGTVHVGAFDAQEVTKILRVPPGIVVVEMIPVGVPQREVNPTPRKELSQFVYYEKYGISSAG
jgi:nitroreductase